MSFKLVEKYGNVFVVVKRKLTPSDVRSIAEYAKRIHIEVVGSFDKDGFYVIRYKSGVSGTGRGIIGASELQWLNDLVYALATMREGGLIGMYVHDCVIESHLANSSPIDMANRPSFNFKSCSIKQTCGGGTVPVAMVRSWNIVDCSVFLANPQTRFVDCVIHDVKLHSTDPSFKRNMVLSDTKLTDSVITDLTLITKGMLVSGCTIADCRLASDVPAGMKMVLEKTNKISEYKSCRFSNTDIYNNDHITFIFEDCNSDGKYGIGLDVVSPQLTVFSGKTVPKLAMSHNVEDRYWVDRTIFDDPKNRTIGCRVDIDTPVTLVADSVISVAEHTQHSLKVKLDITTSYNNIVDVSLVSTTDLSGTKVTLNAIRPTIFSLDGMDAPPYLSGGKNVIMSGASNLYDMFLPLFNHIFTRIDDSKLVSVKKRLKSVKVNQKIQQEFHITNPPPEIERIIHMVNLLMPSAMRDLMP